MTTPPEPPPSYLIIGSGVFGASTALHLIRSHPSASITLVDRDAYTAPVRIAASWDWNKVIRSDYTDIVYTRLGLEAQELWRNDPILKEFYHESGVVWISSGDSRFGEKAVSNFEELGVRQDALRLGVEEAKRVWDGYLRNADFTEVDVEKGVLVNRNSGWAEAKEALQAVIQAAVDLGVRYEVAEVKGVVVEGGRCKGIVTSDGKRLEADRVVLCTGAYTPKLLIDSAPGWKELHAGERMFAMAVTEATVPLEGTEAEMLGTRPVAMNDNPRERGFEVGCLPLPKMSAYKCWGQVIFRNSAESISRPPELPSYKEAQWDVPETLQDDVRWALRSLFGEQGSNKPMENFRICWDAVTSSEDFIISPHSASEGLYIATCGPFHGFKFLPVLGKYVIEMLEGRLDPALQKKWAWDREQPSKISHKKLASVEYKDLLKMEAKS
ncbi:FAD dependent oxidoreductase [Podospora aff. communis PSN243]|uniref:FAD dependent oxidoreductase n=1 Tax=Podospora aff. communis PSN243 TaxID=3040156 RepID=A0AAV9G8L6_9PEZI|nr:FAD dependent oxidoreductase [Podospora aff. communis PSN243]